MADDDTTGDKDAAAQALRAVEVAVYALGDVLGRSRFPDKGLAAVHERAVDALWGPSALCDLLAPYREGGRP